MVAPVAVGEPDAAGLAELRGLAEEQALSANRPAASAAAMRVFIGFPYRCGSSGCQVLRRRRATRRSAISKTPSMINAIATTSIEAASIWG